MSIYYALAGWSGNRERRREKKEEKEKGRSFFFPIVLVIWIPLFYGYGFRFPVNHYIEAYEYDVSNITCSGVARERRRGRPAPGVTSLKKTLDDIVNGLESADKIKLLFCLGSSDSDESSAHLTNTDYQFLLVGVHLAQLVVLQEPIRSQRASTETAADIRSSGVQHLRLDDFTYNIGFRLTLKSWVSRLPAVETRRLSFARSVRAYLFVPSTATRASSKRPEGTGVPTARRSGTLPGYPDVIITSGGDGIAPWGEGASAATSAGARESPSAAREVMPRSVMQRHGGRGNGAPGRRRALLQSHKVVFAEQSGAQWWAYDSHSGVCRWLAGARVQPHLFEVSTVGMENYCTVNSDWYTTICLPDVTDELRKNNRKRCIILHHDNASSHKAKRTNKLLKEQNFNSAYSPDLAPCEFFVQKIYTNYAVNDFHHQKKLSKSTETCFRETSNFVSRTLNVLFHKLVTSLQSSPRSVAARTPIGFHSSGSRCRCDGSRKETPRHCRRPFDPMLCRKTITITKCIINIDNEIAADEPSNDAGAPRYRAGVCACAARPSVEHTPTRVDRVRP
ncbi:hypothetical protein EVAR_56327_1 [Eumeta japonica]|uniref:Mariner Mos1 transposase n=1 Tax=Eumeta variegata TaxID=151549 RepID=A0A4C1YCA3_EUMVA|nr:hypothetical protein EVAR_56327_1 [Eumeta japonica]